MNPVDIDGTLKYDTQEYLDSINKSINFDRWACRKWWNEVIFCLLVVQEHIYHYRVSQWLI